MKITAEKKDWDKRIKVNYSGKCKGKVPSNVSHINTATGRTWKNKEQEVGFVVIRNNGQCV